MMKSVFSNPIGRSFWIIGLLNNIPYVIMLACAKSISEGGTALVFLANIVPSLMMNLSAPYWFDKVSYDKRLASASILMLSSFCIVATFSFLHDLETMAESSSSSSSSSRTTRFERREEEDSNHDGKKIPFYVIMQLFGVALCSAQSGLGGATLMALAGKFDSYRKNTIIVDDDYQTNDENNLGRETEWYNDDSGTSNIEKKAIFITAYSSGTGIAGMMGFAFVFFFTKVCKLSLPLVQIIALLIFPRLYWKTFSKRLAKAHEQMVPTSATTEHFECTTTAISHHNNNSNIHIHSSHPKNETKYMGLANLSDDEFNNNNCNNLPSSKNDGHHFIQSMSPKQRLYLLSTFWPYMIPLFTVYASEYALQSGVWTAIGFPVDDLDSRHAFYMSSNWMYQVGVFISRSSGTFFTAPLSIIWLMPFLQCCNLIFFYQVASQHFWYDNTLLLCMCFFVGLLGGGVYVHAFSRMNIDLPESIAEFALSSASVADSFGILVADISGLYIQSCLYDVNGIQGAVVSCPFR